MRTASTATTSSSRSKNVSTMNRSTPRPSSTCRLLGIERPVLGRIEDLELTERPDRACDEHVLPGDLARLAREADAGRVELLERVVEHDARELAAIRSEGVRLDQLGACRDVAGVHRDDALGRPDVGLLGAAQALHGARDERAHPAVGDERRAGAESVEEAAHGRPTVVPVGTPGPRGRDGTAAGSRLVQWPPRSSGRRARFAHRAVGEPDDYRLAYATPPIPLSVGSRGALDSPAEPLRPRSTPRSVVGRRAIHSPWRPATHVASPNAEASEAAQREPGEPARAAPRPRK